MPNEEQIRNSINEIDSDILKDTLAILLAKNNNVSNNQHISVSDDYKNFAQAILSLKQKYNFPELNFFSTEADLVYIQTGDRRILLTDKENNTREQKTNPIKTEKDENPISKSDNSFENAFENIMPGDTRFSHLEL